MVISALLALVLLIQSEPPSVPAGTRIQARLETRVRTKTSNAGDAVVAYIAEPIRAADKVVVPRGSRLHGRVELVRAGTPEMEGWVRLVFREIQLPDGRLIPAWMTNSFHATPHNHVMRHIVYTGIGAVSAGLIVEGTSRTAAILGGILGGFLLSTNTGKGARDVNLKEGQSIWLQLGQELTLSDAGDAGPQDR
jgi:hypothetical protein